MLEWRSQFFYFFILFDLFSVACFFHDLWLNILIREISSDVFDWVEILSASLIFHIISKEYIIYLGLRNLFNIVYSMIPKATKNWDNFKEVYGRLVINSFEVAAFADK